MAYTVDWISKRITIPVSDLQHLGGDRYRLDMSDVRTELNRLQYSFTEGLWAEQIYQRRDPFVFSGTPYDGIDEFINGYTIQFEDIGSGYRVFVVGSDTNILDVLGITSGVSLAVNNSRGKTIEYVGDGATESQLQEIIDLIASLDSSIDGESLQRVLDILEADEVPSETTYSKLHKLTKEILVQKNVNRQNGVVTSLVEPP